MNLKKNRYMCIYTTESLCCTLKTQHCKINLTSIHGGEAGRGVYKDMS